MNPFKALKGLLNDHAENCYYTSMAYHGIITCKRMTSLISPKKLRGTFPPGLPEYIRQTPLPCICGANPRLLLLTGIMWILPM